MDPPFPIPLWHLGPVVITDVVVVTLVLSASLLLLGVAMLRMRRIRLVLELGYDALERAILDMVSVDAQALVPLILTLWLFIGAANLVGLVPGVLSPTRDLSLTAALAFVSFFAGHVFALRTRGLRYLRQYVEPHPLLLPFNIIGELSRTVALALRLFGNMLSGSLIGAIIVYLAGFLLPVPLMILSVLTSLVQAYIFGVLTLVFAVSSVETVARRGARNDEPPSSPLKEGPAIETATPDQAPHNGGAP
ncbi:MAG: F0F1 ATP synthase subunit A [Myxococcales bacterium]|nr:F0F1 ATP synthase subunit A [Myxococcales bacterium]